MLQSRRGISPLLLKKCHTQTQSKWLTLPKPHREELPKHLNVSFSVVPPENAQRAATNVKPACIWQHVLLIFLFPYHLFQNYPAGDLGILTQRFVGSQFTVQREKTGSSSSNNNKIPLQKAST